MASLFPGSTQVEQERSRVAVTLKLAGGEQLNGHIFVVVSGKLRDTLNNQERFTEFEGVDGRHCFVQKQQIASIAPLDLPKTDQLAKRSKDLNAFDPHSVLGIDRGAGPGEIRAAYWGKARLYHPDKVAGAGVPKEVLEYMNAQFVRIHAAYEQLGGSKEAIPV